MYRRAEHTRDKTLWDDAKQEFQHQIQQLTRECTEIHDKFGAKVSELEELSAAKQRMMEEYEKSIADQTEAYEARIKILQDDVEELKEWKVTSEYVRKFRVSPVTGGRP